MQLEIAYHELIVISILIIMITMIIQTFGFLISRLKPKVLRNNRIQFFKISDVGCKLTEEDVKELFQDDNGIFQRCVEMSLDNYEGMKIPINSTRYWKVVKIESEFNGHMFSGSGYIVNDSLTIYTTAHNLYLSKKHRDTLTDKVSGIDKWTKQQSILHGLTIYIGLHVNTNNQLVWVDSKSTGFDIRINKRYFDDKDETNNDLAIIYLDKKFSKVLGCFETMDYNKELNNIVVGYPCNKDAGANQYLSKIELKRLSPQLIQYNSKDSYELSGGPIIHISTHGDKVLGTHVRCVDELYNECTSVSEYDKLRFVNQRIRL